MQIKSLDNQPDLLSQVHPAAATILASDRRAVMELAAQYLLADLRGQAIDSPQVTERFLMHELREDKSETFCVMFLDTRHRVIQFERMFNGTIDGATVYPRVVAQRALELNAAALILAHNHPSGITDPSLADQAITKRIKDALNLLDIRLLDHFIIGAGQATSMASRGLV
jgi:DNA repair protein RadC